jgi:hypothetical protein
LRSRHGDDLNICRIFSNPITRTSSLIGVIKLSDRLIFISSFSCFDVLAALSSFGGFDYDIPSIYSINSVIKSKEQYAKDQEL